jgi:hypothetical protein
MTTNDMPVTVPASPRAFGLIPFQINPHYLDANPAGHAGETREQRIEEFIEVNREVFVAGLREGTMFILEDRKITLSGPRNARVFRYGSQPVEVSPEVISHSCSKKEKIITATVRGYETGSENSALCRITPVLAILVPRPLCRTETGEADQYLTRKVNETINTGSHTVICASPFSNHFRLSLSNSSITR